MISERTFSRSFQSFWKELFPLLTPSFVHFFNATLSQKIIDENNKEIEHLNPKSKNLPFAVIAEFAFYLVKEAFEQQKEIDELEKNESIIKKITKLAIDNVSKYEGDFFLFKEGFRLTDEEVDFGLKLARNYNYFFSKLGKYKNIEFNPKLQGAGFLDTCECDISFNSTLIEVKTVNRNIASKDIRQLIIYLALQSATHVKKWDEACFFNPRKAVYQLFTVDDFLYQISGGKSTYDIFQNIIDFVSNRETQLDSIF